jgi:hypothetical protein
MKAKRQPATQFAPFALINMRCDGRLSEETPAFTATLIAGGANYTVRNDGRGGDNRYDPPLPSDVRRWLNGWCASHLPAITDCDGCLINPPIPMDLETWTFEQAFASLR